MSDLLVHALLERLTSNMNNSNNNNNHNNYNSNDDIYNKRVFDSDFTIPGCITNSELRSLLTTAFDTHNIEHWQRVVFHFQPIVIIHTNEPPTHILQYLITHTHALALLSATNNLTTPAFEELLNTKPIHLAIMLYPLPVSWFVWCSVNSTIPRGVVPGRVDFGYKQQKQER